MEVGDWEAFFRNPFVFLCLCLGLDTLLGDPPYRWHPVRVMGMLLAKWEAWLRARGLGDRDGGILLGVFLFATVGLWTFGIHATLNAAGHLLGFESWLAWLFDLWLGYSLLALGDLTTHGRRIARACEAGDIARARAATAMLVGRDTAPMDMAACARAGCESIAESLVDGVIAPLFWFALLGLPGLLLFKVASTMDSMVGYKDERYKDFGWFGARLDDAMNWIPARIGFLLIALFGALIPGYSGRKALKVGFAQHALLPGPNKGWSETSAAGALGIRLAGPIYKNGALVNDKWIGAPHDPEGGRPGDIARAIGLAYGVTALFLLLALCWERLGFMPRI